MGENKKSKRWVAVVLVALVLMGVGVLIVRSGSGSESGVPRPSTTSETERSEPTPTTQRADAEPVDGSTTALPASAPGSAVDGSPEAAAIRWAELAARLLYMDSDDAEAAVRKLTDSETVVDEVMERVEENHTLALGADDDTLVWSQWAPLGVKTAEIDADRVAVELWGVGVLSVVPVVDPVSTWGIEQIDLLLVDGEWKVTAADTRPGPVFPGPITQVPVGADEIPSELGGFEPVGGVL